MTSILSTTIWIMSIAGLFLLLLLISNPLIRYINNEVNKLSSFAYITSEVTNFQKYRKFKRLLDVLISFLILSIMSPLLIGLALILKFTTKGPVFSHRVLIGQHGKHFKLLSFAVHPIQKSEFRISHIPPKRPPFTRIGKFLYVTSLAYMPELYNVLVGDLSLIGISPVINYFETKEYLTPAVRKTLMQFKPGLLSLYSVSKDRATDDFHKMQLFDLYYIQHISLKLDFLIFISGIIKVMAKPTYQLPVSDEKERRYSNSKIIYSKEKLNQNY